MKNIDEIKEIEEYGTKWEGYSSPRDVLSVLDKNVAQ
jgi:hypothetical protein